LERGRDTRSWYAKNNRATARDRNGNSGGSEVVVSGWEEEVIPPITPPVVVVVIVAVFGVLCAIA
jgi:preprotein translocase subunit Sec61beta